MNFICYVLLPVFLSPSSLPATYSVGTTLRLHFIPHGVNARDKDNVEAVIHVKILRAFTPFTLGQALVVELDQPLGSAAVGLPPRFVVKLYDRRFVEYRKAPWTPSTDTVLRKILTEIADGRHRPSPLEAIGGTGKDKDGRCYDFWHAGFQEWEDDVEA